MKLQIKVDPATNTISDVKFSTSSLSERNVTAMNSY